VRVSQLRAAFSASDTCYATIPKAIMVGDETGCGVLRRCQCYTYGVKKRCASTIEGAPKIYRFISIRDDTIVSALQLLLSML
jgi:hypothetical protein